MKMNPKDSMEFLNVTPGTINKDQTVKDLNGEEIIFKKGDEVYHVNTVFSLPRYGFIMTKKGRIIEKSEQARQGVDKMPPLTDEQMEQARLEALEHIKNGKVGSLDMKFNF